MLFPRLHHIPRLAPLLVAFSANAQVPNLIPHQGRVAVNGVNFDGTGQFKFALVNAAGTTTYWSNNGSSTAGSQPTAALSLPVTKGLYSVLLGDTSLTNMTAVPASVYTNADLRLRVWFNNGTLGFQQLTPDQRIAPNGYLPDGAITSTKLAPGATPPAVLVSGTSQNVVPNTNYIATGSGTTTFTLPASASIGDVITISGSGEGSSVIVNPDGWTPREQVRYWRAAASSADGTKLVAAEGNGRLYTSSDSGNTWTPREQNRIWTCVASSASGNRLIAGDRIGQLYISADSGVTWTPRWQPRNWWSVASSADGSKLIAAGNGYQLVISDDYGVTWREVGPFVNWPAVASSADGNKLIASSDNGELYTSTDSGETWTQRGPFGRWSCVASSADGAKLVAGTVNGQLYTSTDSGATWVLRVPSGPSWFSSASSADGSRLVAAAYDGNLYISKDSGVTWLSREQNRKWWSVASSSDGSRLIAAAQDAQLYTYPGILTATGGESARFTYGNQGWVLNPSFGSWTATGADVYRAAGNVGIGTATPLTRLDVKGVTRTHRLGIGTAAPNFPVSFGTGAANTLLALFDPGASGAYGLGIGSSQFRLHLGDTGARFSFLDTPAGNELMTIKGTGRVGIGTADPVSALHVNGVITGNGSGLTNLSAAHLIGAVPAASLTSLPAANLAGSVPAATLTSVPSASLTGTLNVARLPAEVALRGNANTFLGAQTIATGGNFTQPQLLLSQTTADDWSRLRMQAVGGPPWDIALCPGAAPVMNFYNGSANVFSLEQDGDAWLQRNLNFSAGTLRQMIDLWNGEHGIGVQALTTYFRTNGTVPGAFAWYQGGVHNDAAYNSGGGVELMRLDSAGLRVRGTFVSSSDRNRKENIQPVNAREILEKVAALPVSRWNYKDDAETPHIGPMAQDFHAAFGAGADDKHIAMVDADGVALAAIKGLNEKLRDELQERDQELNALRKEKDAEIAKLREETDRLRDESEARKRETAALREVLSRQNTALEARLQALERREGKAANAKTITR